MYFYLVVIYILYLVFFPGLDIGHGGGDGIEVAWIGVGIMNEYSISSQLSSDESHGVIIPSISYVEIRMVQKKKVGRAVRLDESKGNK